jgi:hypothetical protein
VTSLLLLLLPDFIYLARFLLRGSRDRGSAGLVRAAVVVAVAVAVTVTAGGGVEDEDEDGVSVAGLSDDGGGEREGCSLCSGCLTSSFTAVNKGVLVWDGRGTD